MTSGYQLGVDGMDTDSSSSSWEDVEELEIEENLCHPLLLNSLILEKIFDFLPTTELLVCRSVCREWNKTALLRKVLGSKFKITVSKGNLDKLIRIGQTSYQPFCRKFDFRSLDLEGDKVSKFIRIFGDKLSCLDLKYCTTSTQESVLKIFNCPRLEELKIYGSLPNIIEGNLNKFIFSRLHSISLNSSVDFGQVDKEFIRLLLKYAPKISKIYVGTSISLWTDLCSVLGSMSESKMYHVGLSGIELPLEIVHFEMFTSPRLGLHKLDLENCIVRPEFMNGLLQQSCKTLERLTVRGTQQEIISKAFINISMRNVTNLVLPIDGISASDGTFIIESSPSLKRLEVGGLFDTTFCFEKGTLLSITMKEKYFINFFSRDNVQHQVLHEKRREFRKVIGIIKQQPNKLEICLSVTFVNSRCIREIYASFPQIQHFSLVTNSVRECLVGLTGIPYRLCKRMAQCKSFAVTPPSKVKFLPGASSLKKLKQLELTILDENITTELTLLCVIYGICEIICLEKLSLTNFKISDVAFMIMAQNLKLKEVIMDGSFEKWEQFNSVFKKHTIKSFLLPPVLATEDFSFPSQVIGSNPKIVKNIFNYMDVETVFECRRVCQKWNSFSAEFLHKSCNTSDSHSSELCNRLLKLGKSKGSTSSHSSQKLYHLGDSTKDTPQLPYVLRLWSQIRRETTIVIVSLGKPALEAFQRENNKSGKKTCGMSCRRRRQLEYWYYPDGSDAALCYNGKLKTAREYDDLLSQNIDTLFVIGSWGRKDSGLLEFLNPAWSTSTLHLTGLQKEALDLVLPKVTTLMNLEALYIRPFIPSSPYCDVTKTHLQILSNSSFKLSQFSMQFSAPSEYVVDFVRSQRFTLQVVELHSNVNISDRLTFSMPQLKVLKLDEPPGCLLWTTLNIHSSLESINFGRSNCSLNPVKNKSFPKVDLVDAEMHHSATEILCDINWFLESAAARRQGVQKSILQQGSDTALKFFRHFPFLTSLTLRSVHAHYGLLQGVFKKFSQLKKLALINASGVTDEILTGFSKEILAEMDIMNPFQAASHGGSARSPSKTAPSIRNLKGLTHLSLDDQPLCTDFSVIFGILRLDQLEYFSCSKWKITDVSVRALADLLPSLKQVNTEGCATVSSRALEYFEQFRPKIRQKATI